LNLRHGKSHALSIIQDIDRRYAQTIRYKIDSSFEIEFQPFLHTQGFAASQMVETFLNGLEMTPKP
jgi:hypothetical protein